MKTVLEIVKVDVADIVTASGDDKGYNTNPLCAFDPNAID